MSEMMEFMFKANQKKYGKDNVVYAKSLGIIFVQTPDEKLHRIWESKN